MPTAVSLCVATAGGRSATVAPALAGSGRVCAADVTPGAAGTVAAADGGGAAVAPATEGGCRSSATPQGSAAAQAPRRRVVSRSLPPPRHRQRCRAWPRIARPQPRRRPRRRARRPRSIRASNRHASPRSGQPPAQRELRRSQRAVRAASAPAAPPRPRAGEGIGAAAGTGGGSVAGRDAGHSLGRAPACIGCAGAGAMAGGGTIIVSSCDWPARGDGICAVGLKVTGRDWPGGATCAVGRCVGMWAVCRRVGSTVALTWRVGSYAAEADLCAGDRRRDRDAGPAARPERGAGQTSTALLTARRLCGRCFGRIDSIHDTASRKRGETPGTMRFSIWSVSSCTARAVAGAGGAPNSR